MSDETAGNKKRGREGSNPVIAPPSNSGPCIPEADLDLSNDIKGILAALQQVRDKAKNDGQKRNEEIINSLAAEIKAMVDDLKTKADKERQNFIKAATKICKECESALKDESNKYQSIYEKFCKEKASHLQAYEETFLKFEDGKEKLLGRYEQQRKKEKAAVLELQKICSEKISATEEIIRKKKQEEKSFNILRKTLGSFLESNSDDDL